jgi:glycosyltransferase involved in cell wall biosynthesis
VEHGLPEDLYRPKVGATGKYLAFLGRVSPEKRPEVAIQVAIRAGLPLRIAAKVDPADAAYFETVVRPLLAHPLIDFIGEIGDGQKSDFLGDALALIVPIDWPEPFGLVMIEALACGCPVIAWDRGSVPKLIEHGVTGFVVHTEEEALAAIARIGEIDRARARSGFEQRFSARRMAQNYERVYMNLLGSRMPAASGNVGSA